MSRAKHINSQRRSFEVVLAGSSALLRECIGQILISADFRIVASAPCVNPTVLCSLSQQQSLLLIIDDGDAADSIIQQMELFRGHRPRGRIAVLAQHCRPAEIVAMFRAGTNAYFVDVTSSDVFIRGLDLVMLGETYIPPVVMSWALTRKDEQYGQSTGLAPAVQPHQTPNLPIGCPKVLSKREEGVLRWLSEGCSNKVIARRVEIAEATVKVHVKTILRKIQAQNRTQAALWAIQNGLAKPTEIQTSSASSSLSTYTEASVPTVKGHGHD